LTFTIVYETQGTNFPKGRTMENDQSTALRILLIMTNFSEA